MLTTVIKRRSYQDSITLMLLTNRIAEMEGVTKVSIMMGTSANKDILTQAGLYTTEFSQAGANDIIVAMDIVDADLVETILAAIDEFLAKQGEKTDGNSSVAVRNWEQALSNLPDANLVMLSIPGAYAESEAMRALDEEKHVFIFSDNVPLAAEKRLKEKAAAKGLLVMGPDCGTALIAGSPLAFANSVPRGNIGIVGASGTGIQEISTQIAQLGGGVSHAIGTGGRDISAEVGGLTMHAALAALALDSATDCIVVVSKPPAPDVKQAVFAQLQTVGKPVVVHFLGERFDAHQPGIYFAASLEEAARFAVSLSKGEAPDLAAQPLTLGVRRLAGSNLGIRGLYTGGTLACEAALMIESALGVSGNHQQHVDGYMLNSGGHTVIDLGDDVYTQGKPHPMIAPQSRVAFIKELARDPLAGVVLLDFVLGYGAHDDMVSETLPSIVRVQELAHSEGREIRFIATICGTQGDHQGFAQQKAALEKAGVLVAPNNASAVATALASIGLVLEYAPLPVPGAVSSKETCPLDPAETCPPGSEEAKPLGSSQVKALLDGGVSVINIGLSSFTRPFVEMHIPFVQFDWQPVAGGNRRLIQALNFLDRFGKEAEAHS